MISGMNPYLFIALQIAVGVVIVVVVFYLSLFMIRQDKLVVDKEEGSNDSHFEVKMIKGYIDSNKVAKKRFSTLNPMDKSFVPIPRAYNRMGGAQFSYSFWLFVGDTHPSSVRNKDILLKGAPDALAYRKVSKTNADATPFRVVQSQIKCPKLGFGNSFKDIVIEFNTQDDVNHRVNLSATPHPIDVTIRHNLMDLIQNKWVYIAVTMEDNVPINDFENGIIVRFYVNDILYYTHRVASTLKQNNGDLFLFPEGEIKGCRIADLKYHNYAIGFKEVKMSHGNGPPKFRADEDESVGSPLYISEYNKIDMYNR